ncbi:Phosphotransferase enzyme family [Nocardia africana]|uniref:Phosphotransferase enzyme family n=2 Tax=Nocardia africana TaxID=134964 RepID=A0A378WZ79_9NOCA|nr:Phosphotransferase enzyme family [Nocardia africana]
MRMTAQLAGNGTLSVLRAACVSAGFEPGGAREVRFGARTGYRLPSGVVVRISRPDHRPEARREIEAARWLSASGIATLQTVPDVRQPLEIQGRTVTFWQAPPPYHNVTAGDLAEALHRLHSTAPPTTFTLGRLQPFLGIAQLIETADLFTGDDRRWLHARLAELRGRWAHLPNGMQWGVIHGEAWGREFAATVDDGVLVLNLENLSIGPPEWDLVPTAIAYASLGWISSAQYAGFCDAYHLDVIRWPGFFLLRDIVEFRMTMDAVRAAVADPIHRHQARWRLACIRGDEGPRQWPGWVPLH